jgi:hypothetical protein
MSTLVYDTLETELEQEVFIGNHLGLYSPIIAPWLFFKNDPAGTFTMGIYKEGTLLAEKSFTIADFKTQLNGVGLSGHLFYRIDFRGVHLPYGFYVLKLSSTGYTYSKQSLLAWCKEWDVEFDKNPDIGSVEWTQRPLATRIISFTPREV